MSIENSEGFILSIKERELAKKPHDSLKLPRKVTIHGPEKNVRLDIPTDNPELDDVYHRVILNNNKDFFSDSIYVLDFLDRIVDMICREAKTRNLKTASVEEKKLIKLKLERSQKILEFLKQSMVEKESHMEEGVSFPGLIKQQIDLVREQLKRYK
ncbi:MAG: hypothetical protein PHQ18_02125 [Patescibacteria group bacterium]|nr:hypothetical protein [Patescibacteria group bacterium]